MTRQPRMIVEGLCALGLVVLGLVGCSAGSSRSSTTSGGLATATTTVSGNGFGAFDPKPAASGASPATTVPTTGQNGVGLPVTPGQPRIVRNGDVHVGVAKGRLHTGFDQVAGLATGNGGFVADSDFSTGSGQPSARLVLRIPSENLTAVVTALARVGTVGQETLQGSDVTGQLVDLGARITTLRAEEDAVRTLLGRAQQIGDILQIQSQLFDLRTQIEQLTAQQSQLSNQASFATLSVELTETATPVRPTPASHPGILARAWRLASDNTVAVLDGIALAVGWATPLLIMAVLLLPFLLWWRRRQTGRPESRPTAAQAIES